MASIDDEELLKELGVDLTPVKNGAHSPQEERLIAGFEDILRFVDTHGRIPQHGEDRDIFERVYAVRLDRLRGLESAHPLLASLDTHGLLTNMSTVPVLAPVDDLDDEVLLGLLRDVEPAAGDISQLRHVRTYRERQAAEEVAGRTKCGDFDQFKPLFEKVQRELASGERRVLKLDERSLDEIREGIFFIIGGQTAYVAEEQGVFMTDYDRRDMRLRVIYDNGTESELLQRSLQRALHRDKVARLVSNPEAGPLFGDGEESDDVPSGTIYVLRSHSNHEFVAANRHLVHKIGVCGGAVAKRVGNAANEATYLLAGVDVVAEYRLANINRTKLENLIHRIFAPALIDIEIPDRFGKLVKPREWFLVPITVIDEAVERIRDGSITDMVYDPRQARLVRTFRT